MIPENVGWRFGRELYDTRQINRTTSINVKVWTAKYVSCRFCNRNKRTKN